MTDELLDGLDALRHREAHWLQVDVAAPQLTANAIADAVDRAANKDNAGRMTGRWWFVRKPPGVRIRQETREPGSSDAVLTAFTALGPSTLSVYESERYRFGGDDGMEVAHDLFTFDCSLAVIRERVEVPPVRWSTCVLGDLARRLTDDGAEEWDAWKRLEQMLSSIVGRAASSTVPDPAVGGDGTPHGLSDVLARGHGIVERRLRATTLSGIGPRSWFGAAAVFHWNRLGLRPEDMQTVAADALRGIEER
jgi:thiopeptide-type bacteriocin biosynthesis protein